MKWKRVLYGYYERGGYALIKSRRTWIVHLNGLPVEDGRRTSLKGAKLAAEAHAETGKTMRAPVETCPHCGKPLGERGARGERAGSRARVL